LQCELASALDGDGALVSIALTASPSSIANVSFGASSTSARENEAIGARAPASAPDSVGASASPPSLV
jgi:hypothetical protein